MKSKAQRKSKGKGGRQIHTGNIQKFMVSVNNFVKSKGGFDENENNQRETFVKKKSRKELRKEKRKLKKAEMKNHYMRKSLLKHSEEPAQNSPAVNEENTQKPGVKPTGNLKNAAQRQQKTNKDNISIKDGVEETTKKKVHFSEHLPKPRQKTSVSKSRKLALLEANVEEDKEIKKLEKRLGLNKRKNKKSLPQSFANDGLDYILGILEPGASATGLYGSDEEMDTDKAKNNFDELEEDSDGQMTDDGNKDDSGDEDDTDEGDGEDDTHMEEEEEDVEDDTQIEDYVEEHEEEEDHTDASDENDHVEEVESEQKRHESHQPVCCKSFIIILV